MDHGGNRHLAELAMFLALASVMGYLEALLPIDIGIPGIRAGLANYVIVLAMFFFGAGDAALISILRVFLVGFMLSNLSMILYSLSGAVLSLSCMAFLKKRSHASVYGVSAAGGVMHNIGQWITAGIMLGFRAVVWYLPVLLIAGLLAGLLIGFLVSVSYRRLDRIIHRG